MMRSPQRFFGLAAMAWVIVPTMAVLALLFILSAQRDPPAWLEIAFYVIFWTALLAIPVVAGIINRSWRLSVMIFTILGILGGGGYLMLVLVAVTGGATAGW